MGESGAHVQAVDDEGLTREGSAGEEMACEPMACEPMACEPMAREQIARDILPRYDAALRWLYSFFTNPQGENRRPKRTPEEWRELMPRMYAKMELLSESMGRPQDRFPAVHIAGTGGKGSTTMLIGRILEGVSDRVGVHISPYLQVPGEKLVINGRLIAPSRFVDLVASMRAEHERFVARYPDVKLSHGMMQVGLFYLYFAQSDLDWGVVETGRGGRFDLTNVVAPELAVITNIDFDHVTSLGPELWRIAWQKAGIIEKGKPAITGERKAEALSVIREEARTKGSRLYCPGEDFDWHARSIDQSGVTLDVQAPYQRYDRIQIPILGPFQIQNAGLAVAAVDVLAHEYGLALDGDVVRGALADMVLPGRMEVMQREPLVIIDGAHNPQKTCSLAKAMRGLYPDRRFTLVFGMLGSKDAGSSLQHLVPQAGRVIVTRPHVVGKRATEPRELADVVRSTGFEGPIDACSGVMEALDEVLEGAAEDEIILITGSLYMIGEARGYWVEPRKLLIDAELGYRYL